MYHSCHAHPAQREAVRAAGSISHRLTHRPFWGILASLVTCFGPGRAGTRSAFPSRAASFPNVRSPPVLGHPRAA